MKSVPLHQRLVQAFRRIGVEATQPQRENLAFLCQALAVSPNCHLATLALGIPLAGSWERVLQRLSRFLATEALDPALCYRPLAGHVVAHWTGCELNLVMDRTDLEDRWSVVVGGVASGKRVLPLAWELLPFGGTGAATQTRLLHRIAPLVRRREDLRVYFSAESEFRTVAVQRVCQRYGWHWQVGLKSDLLFRQGDGPWQPVRAIELQPGERRCLPAVTLTQAHAFGPVNLIAAWALTQETPRYWALDQPADGRAWRRGRKRLWVEPTFRDWKSYGFDLERSKLTDPHRLNVLLVGITVTTRWLMHLGDWLRRTGRDRLVARPDQSDSSLFRLGRDYIQRARTLNYSIRVGFTVPHTTSRLAPPLRGSPALAGRPHGGRFCGRSGAPPWGAPPHAGAPDLSLTVPGPALG